MSKTVTTLVTNHKPSQACPSAAPAERKRPSLKTQSISAIEDLIGAVNNISAADSPPIDFLKHSRCIGMAAEAIDSLAASTKNGEVMAAAQRLTAAVRERRREVRRYSGPIE